jgi:hypothetical protein
METVYVTTHLLMVICTITVLSMAFQSPKTVNNQEKPPVINRLYLRGVNLINAIAATSYKVALNIFISYLK